MCQRSSLALPAKQDSYLLLPQSPFGQNLSQGLGFIGWWGGNSTGTEMEGRRPFENERERERYLYTYIFFLFNECFTFSPLPSFTIEVTWLSCPRLLSFNIADENVVRV